MLVAQDFFQENHKAWLLKKLMTLRAVYLETLHVLLWICSYVITFIYIDTYMFVLVLFIVCMEAKSVYVCVFVFVHMLRLFYRFCNSPRRGLVAWLCGIFCMTCRETGLQRMALKLKLLLVITITSCWAIISNVNNISYVAHFEFS